MHQPLGQLHVQTLHFKISCRHFLHKLEPPFLKLFIQMFITTSNPGFKLLIVDINFDGTFEQVSTKVSVVSIISMIKIKVLVHSTDF